MENLRNETIEILENYGKTPNDIRWIGTNGKLYFDGPGIPDAFDREYNDSYGDQLVNPFLLIVGDDWWLERHEYDGSEWWEFKTLPKKPDEKGIAEVFGSW